VGPPKCIAVSPDIKPTLGRVAAQGEGKRPYADANKARWVGGGAGERAVKPGINAGATHALEIDGEGNRA
jgi:hypothetical protein